MDALLGKTDAKGRDYIVFQDNGLRGNYGLRDGNWKLQRHDSKRMYNGDLSMRVWPVPQFTLFDLENDIGETKDISAEYPEIFNTMKNQLQKIIDDGRTRN